MFKSRRKPPPLFLQFKNVLCLLVQLNQKVFEGHNNFINPKNLTETTPCSLIRQQMALYNYWYVHV